MGRRRGFTLVEILIVVAIVLLLLGLAAPKLARSRIGGFEGAAMRAIQTLHVAQAQFYSENGRHAASLAELAQKGNILGDLAAGDKSGYSFELKATKTGYEVFARPQHSGARRFYSNESLAIFAADAEAAESTLGQPVQPPSLTPESK